MKKIFKLLSKLGILLLSLFLLVVTVNDRVDKYGILHGGHYERQIAEIWQQGQPIGGYDESILDERQIIEIYLSESEPKDYLAVGSSRFLQLTKDYIPEGSTFFNAGASGLDFRDLCNLYYTLEQQGKLPDTMIIALDPWLLNGSPECFSGRSDVNLYHEFLAVDLQLPVSYQKEDTSAKREALFSLTAFQENIAYLFRDRTEEKVPVVATGDFYNEDIQVRLADGSQLYPLSYRTRTQEEIDLDALSTILNPFFRIEGFTRFDADLQMQFEALIDRMQSDGIQLVFVLIPYHPTTYELSTVHAERFPAFFDVEPYYYRLAKEKGIPIYGSYDPLVSGCVHADFYDGLHIKREALPLVFPGFEGSLMYQRHAEQEQKTKDALVKMQELQLQDIHEPWMDELQSYINRPKTPRKPQTPQ